MIANRYEIVVELGRGGMGRVMRARDLKLGRDVALKLLVGPVHSPEHCRRLQQEARAAGALNHPNIVDVHDTGEDGGEPYIVTELLEGKTLRAILTSGPLAPEQVLDLASQLAKGLAAAHSKGIVHRDLKPENLFVTADGRLKILDFGIAKLLEAPAGARTDTGGVIGTPGYMSPEQLRGQGVDARSDVFSFGTVVQEMLTGVSPFERATPVDTSHAILHEAAPTLPASAPQVLREVVGKALEKDRNDRFADGSEIAARLRGGGPGARKRLVARTAIVLLIAPAAWFIAMRAARDRPATTPRSTSKAVGVLPFTNLSGDPGQDYFVEGITAQLINNLSRIPGLSVPGRTTVGRFKGSTAAPSEIGAALGVDYLLEGSVQRAGNRIRVISTLIETKSGLTVWSEDSDHGAEEIFKVQENIARHTVEVLALKLDARARESLKDWGTKSPEAYDEFLKARKILFSYAGTGKQFAAAASHCEKAVAIDGRFAAAWASLAIAEVALQRNFAPDGLVHLRRAEAASARALELDPHLLNARLAKAFLHMVHYEHAEAAAEARKLIADDPQDPRHWQMLSWSLAYMEPPQLEEAVAAGRRAVQLDPEYPHGLYHLTRALALSGRLDEAQRVMASLDEKFPATAYTTWAHFWFELCSGRPREALAVLGEQRRPALETTWQAIAQAQVGQLDDAFLSLDRALADGFRDLPALHRSKWFQPLREDPRFTRLLAKHNLE